MPKKQITNPELIIILNKIAIAIIKQNKVLEEHLQNIDYEFERQSNALEKIADNTDNLEYIYRSL